MVILYVIDYLCGKNKSNPLETRCVIQGGLAQLSACRLGLVSSQSSIGQISHRHTPVRDLKWATSTHSRSDKRTFSATAHRFQWTISHSKEQKKTELDIQSGNCAISDGCPIWLIKFRNFNMRVVVFSCCGHFILCIEKLCLSSVC